MKRSLIDSTFDSLVPDMRILGGDKASMVYSPEFMYSDRVLFLLRMLFAIALEPMTDCSYISLFSLTTDIGGIK